MNAPASPAPDQSDLDAIARVAKKSDLSRPMDVDFMVAFADAASCNAFAARPELAAFAVEVSANTESSGWTCYCSCRLLLTGPHVARAQADLDVVAREHGGFIDGWGTFGNAD